MGGNYEKSVYNQLMEVMEKLNSMESEHSRDRKEVEELTTEVTGLRKENVCLREEVSNLKQKTSSLEEENTSLKAENRLLHDDNERMKRILDNDSSNSSTPPSKDSPGKAPNTFNGRKPTKRKVGAQPGHKGSGMENFRFRVNLRPRFLTEGRSKRLLPFCIVKGWSQMTVSAHLLTPFLVTSSTFRPGVYMDSAKNLLSPVLPCEPQLSRSF